MDVSNEEARRILQSEWEYVEGHFKAVFLDPARYSLQLEQISDVISGEQVTYRYILLTAALSKVANPDVHYRALQKGSELEGAYDARSVAHGVVVPFEKSHGERLGGSNEPFLNRPARYREVDMSNRDRNRSAQKRLFDLLEFCQTRSQADKEFPRAFLRQVLKEMIAVPPSRREFRVPPVQATLKKTVQIVDDYLATSGSGERLVAICAAVFSSISPETQVQIVAYPVNWSDKFAKTAGDIEFKVDTRVVKAAEAKDKPITESDVRHCLMKAKQHNLTEYLMLSGAGIVSSDRRSIDEFIDSETVEGINICIIDVPRDLRPYLVYMGEEGRKHFLDEVGNFLNEIKATRDNKEAWQQLLDRHFPLQ